MEKLSKQKKDAAFVLDVRTIPVSGLMFDVTATPEQCADLAQAFDIPTVHEMTADVSIKPRGDVYCLNANVHVCMERVCVVTLEPFEEKLDFEFAELFSENVSSVADEAETFDLDMEDEPIEPIVKGRIRFKDVLWEQIGLNLNPFPKKTADFYEYREANAADFKENPFAVLKNLIKS